MKVLLNSSVAINVEEYYTQTMLLYEYYELLGIDYDKYFKKWTSRTSSAEKRCEWHKKGHQIKTKQLELLGMVVSNLRMISRAG